MSFFFIQLQFCSLQEIDSTNSKPTLTLLAVLPFPNDILRPLYSGGPSLVPAVQLAMEHINNNSQILPEYTLDMLTVDSGCNTQSARLVLLSNVVHGSQPIAGIIGLPCSIAALGIAPLNNEERLGVTQLIAGTSPQLNSRSDYPITFGIVSSSLVFAKAFVALIERNNWKKISVFFESDNAYYISVYQSFLEMFSNKFSTTNIRFTTAVTQNFVPLREVEDLGIRIIIAIASEMSIRSMLCLAYHRNMLFPTYQFIIMELAIETLLQEHTYQSHHCTVEMIQTALNGSILTSYNFTSIAPETVTFSGLKFVQVQSEYRRKLKEYGDKMNMTLEEEPQSYQYVFYDAVWAYAMALHKSVPLLRDINQSFPTLPMFWNNASEVIRDSMYKTQFQGVSGWISFDNETGHASTVVDILQVNDVRQAVLVGYYNAGQPIVINDDGSFVEEEFEFSVLHPAVTTIGSAFVLIALLLSIALYAATLYYREKPTVKATTPKLNFLIFLGCCLITGSVIALTVQNSIPSSSEAIGTGFCNAYAWSFSFGYTLIFGTIFVKSWRLYRIFFRSFEVGEYLSNFTLFLIVMAFLVVDIIICIIWLVTFPVKEHRVDVSSTPLRVILQRTCTYTWFVGVEFAYKGLLTLAVLCLAIANRRIKHKKFRNSKRINTLVYLLILVIGIGLPTSIILNQLNFNINATYSVTSAMSFTVVFLCLDLLFLPPLIVMLKVRSNDTLSSHRL